MKIGFYSDCVLGDEMVIDEKLQKKLICTDINVLNLEYILFTGVKKSKKDSICLYSKAKDFSFF